MSPSPIDPTREIPFGPLLGRCAHLSRECVESHLKAFDMTPAQTHLLMHIHHLGDEATQRQLVSFLHVKPSSANGLLERLEERGLIARTISPKDARQRIVTLTPQGVEMQAAIHAQLQAGEDHLLQCFTPEEAQQFKGYLLRLFRTLEEDRTP